MTLAEMLQPFYGPELKATSLLGFSPTIYSLFKVRLIFVSIQKHELNNVKISVQKIDIFFLFQNTNHKLF